MQIKPHVSFVPDTQLEARAYTLLERYHREIQPVLAPPVPVEKIADFLLELGILWAAIPDTDDDPILACIHPKSKIIHLNEARQDHFGKYMGTFEFTLAHELGHYDLHLVESQLEQIPFDFGESKAYICRDKSKTAGAQREWQAERFASYLLMPSRLLLPAIEDVDLLRWPNLYGLRDKFSVSITALKIRLENLGLIYVDPDGGLHRSKAEAHGQLPLL
jgi:Zn-dependent peptidase ImmA (M78 family)